MTIEEIQAAYYMVAATGVLVAAAYYIQNMRNLEKIRKRDLIFQRLQPSSRDFVKSYHHVMRMTDWKTVKEWRQKYSHWVDPEAAADWFYTVNHYNALGMLLKDGIVPADQIFQLYSPVSIIQIYERFKPIISIGRTTTSGETHSDMYAPYEFLYHEAKRRYPKIDRMAESREEFI